MGHDLRVGAAVIATLALAGCGGEAASTIGTDDRSDVASARADLPQGSERVDLHSLGLTTTIDHPLWPMRPGARWVYRETDGETVQRIEVTVTDERKQVDGIDVLVVRDVVTEDGEPVEDTRDWYAQDRAGNIWYLGEDTAEFEHGEIVNTDGSWEAGVDGAQAGVIVPAAPTPGLEYREEYWKGEAEDRARVLSLDEFAQTPFRRFTDGLLLTRNTNPLEPEQLEYKLYAPGVGPVLVLQASGGSAREELLEFAPGRAQ